jgi:hypothetical protein
MGAVGASEMATGVVAGSAVILAPASSPPLGPRNTGISATVVAPASIVMAGAAHDVR